MRLGCRPHTRLHPVRVYRIYREDLQHNHACFSFLVPTLLLSEVLLLCSCLVFARAVVLYLRLLSS